MKLPYSVQHWNKTPVDTEKKNSQNKHIQQRRPQEAAKIPRQMSLFINNSDNK
jgi:hypothetical protein